MVKSNITLGSHIYVAHSTKKAKNTLFETNTRSRDNILSFCPNNPIFLIEILLTKHLSCQACDIYQI